MGSGDTAWKVIARARQSCCEAACSKVISEVHGYHTLVMMVVAGSFSRSISVRSETIGMVYAAFARI